MSEVTRPFQFTIRRLMLATFWFCTAAFLVTGIWRAPFPSPHRTLNAYNICFQLACLCAAVPAVGCGVGTLFGRPIIGALSAIAVFIYLVCLFMK